MKFSVQASLLALTAVGLSMAAQQASYADSYTMQQETRTVRSTTGGSPGLTDYRYTSPTSDVPTVFERPVYVEKRETVLKKETISTEREPGIRRVIRTARVVRPRVRIAYLTPRRIVTHTHNQYTSSTASSKVTTIEKTVEKPIIVERPVMVDRPVDRIVDRPVYVPTPVYRDRVIERPVYIDRCVNRPVVIDRPMVEELPVIIEKKESRRGLLHLGVF